MRSKPTVSQDEKHATQATCVIIRNSISADRSQNYGSPYGEGSRKPCVCSLSRSNPVATFCFLSCETSSSLPSRSRRHTSLKASKVPRDMEGARNSFSPSGAEYKDKGEVIHPGSLDLLEPLVERVRTCGKSVAGREADRMDTN